MFMFVESVMFMLVESIVPVPGVIIVESVVTEVESVVVVVSPSLLQATRAPAIAKRTKSFFIFLLVLVNYSAQRYKYQLKNQIFVPLFLSEKDADGHPGQGEVLP